jgi:hypothetical protein
MPYLDARRDSDIRALHANSRRSRTRSAAVRWAFFSALYIRGQIVFLPLMAVIALICLDDEAMNLHNGRPIGVELVNGLRCGTGVAVWLT